MGKSIDAVLVAKNITKDFSGVRAVDHVNFKLKKSDPCLISERCKRFDLYSIWERYLKQFSDVTQNKLAS